jgi:hypothetical protein
MLAITTLLTLLLAHWIGLPPEKAAISVLVLTVTPHVQAMIQKGKLRVAGALLATGWALVTFTLVGLLPHLPLLAALLFLGIFTAAYITATAGEKAYAGIQMGLVLPMLVVGPRSEFGSLAPAVQRLEGVVLGLFASVAVALFWPQFPVAAKQPSLPPAALPAEMDV